MVFNVMKEGAVHATAADWLYEAIERVDGDVLLASPYLSYDVCRHLARVASRSDYRWQLFTCLDPSAVANGFLRTDGLRELQNGGVNIRHVDRLHAKTFVVGGRGFLGSANLTGAGLGSSKSPNVELGVELGMAQVLSVKVAMESWSSREITADDLKELHAQARQLTRAAIPSADGIGGVSGLALVEQLLLDARDRERSLWLKSEYGVPALDKWRSEWFFGNPPQGPDRKWPPTIKPGDLVLIRAQTGDCYAVVEVTSRPEDRPKDYVEERGHEANRWPWVNRTKPRFVPHELLELKANELVRSTGGLQNGYIRLSFEQFTDAVRSLARLMPDGRGSA
ncbi:phospholipase D-like domain-containing protein [Crystallibacter degradans]|uniref:phospholipase D-like domain-containing protein n=1 Tax=Crystallibacter degradans TaxID=2726743 RepID=UPI00147297B3|nr:phospholipase D-like domain-containing protein [Arthrobacter sp. SF27]NMR32373.1 hypothetical protein [Arthrobacter sp. SF27]